MSLAIVRVIAIVLFLYMTWRNLRGDYVEKKLITFAWVAVFLFLLFGRLGFGVLNLGVWDSWKDWFMVWSKPGMNYLTAILGFILAVLVFGKINQWKFFTFIEDNLRNFLVLLFLFLVDELIRSRFDWRIIFYLMIILITYSLDIWLFGKYRSFVWYKSGKKGFVFLFSGFFASLLLVLISILLKESLFLITLLSLLSLTSFIGLLVLGEVFEQLNFKKGEK